MLPEEKILTALSEFYTKDLQQHYDMLSNPITRDEYLYYLENKEDLLKDISKDFDKQKPNVEFIKTDKGYKLIRNNDDYK